METPNLPILYRNVMDGLPSAFACDVFLWAVDRPNEDRMCYRAEFFAREADYLYRTLGTILSLPTIRENNSGFTDEIRADLMAFILKRHANWRYGGNQNPGYPEATHD